MGDIMGEIITTPRVLANKTAKSAIDDTPDVGDVVLVQRSVNRKPDLRRIPLHSLNVGPTVANNDALPPASASLLGARYRVLNINGTGYPGRVECVDDRAGGYQWVMV